MNAGLRIVIASYGPPQFRFLQETLTATGHVPVAYLVSRSMRPSTSAEPDLLEATNAIVADVPPGMDLLLPGGVGTMVNMLSGYKPDVLLVFGFNWRLPREVLELPRLGVLNVHPCCRGQRCVVHPPVQRDAEPMPRARVWPRRRHLSE